MLNYKPNQPQGGIQMNQMGAPNMPPAPPGMGNLKLFYRSLSDMVLK
jgi:hypothetical protein